MFHHRRLTEKPASVRGVVPESVMFTLLVPMIYNNFCYNTQFIISHVMFIYLFLFRLGLNALQPTPECFLTFDSDPLVISQVLYTVYYSPNDANSKLYSHHAISVGFTLHH